MKKKWWLSLAVSVAALIGTVRAQDISGIWQGTFQGPQGREMRLQFRIVNEGGAPKGTAALIDQGAGLLPANVTVLAGTVKIVLPGVNATFEGKLAADVKTIDGTMTLVGPPQKLTLTKVTADAAWVPPPAPPRPAAMPADWKGSFEVATIKPSSADAQGQSITVRGRTFRTNNQTVAGMMTFALGIHPDQIVGAPQWIKQDRFDITAEPEGTGMPNDRQWKAALAKLLADRFTLTFHRDKKELSVYALTTLRTGHKLTKNDTNPNGLPALFFRGPGVFPVQNATMGDFTGTMQAVVLDRPVVDQTGLEGRYDFTLTWTPDETQFGGRGGQLPPPADPDKAPPGLFTAIQEQLGLKLEATKAPVDVIVIDKLEKPTAN